MGGNGNVKLHSQSSLLLIVAIAEMYIMLSKYFGLRSCEDSDLQCFDAVGWAAGRASSL